MESSRKHIVIKNRNRIPIDVFSLILENCTIASAYNTWARLCYISAKAARKARSKHIKRFLTKKTKDSYPFVDHDYDYDIADEYDYIKKTQTYFVLPNGKKHGTQVKSKERGHNQWSITKYEWDEGILISTRYNSP